MWPGSDYEYDGVACKHNQHFNLSIDYTKRVDEVFKWILDPISPANLIMFYIEEPDLEAHAFGTDSQVITDLVKNLDSVTEHFHRKIKSHSLEHRVSVVHLSDHGMDNLAYANIIDLTKVIDANKVKFFGSTPGNICPHIF